MTPLDDADRARIEVHMSLARYMAAKHCQAHAALEYEECLSAAHMGLIRAAQNFKEERGVLFGAYAYIRIRSFLLDLTRASMRERGWKRSPKNRIQIIEMPEEFDRAAPEIDLDQDILLEESLRLALDGGSTRDYHVMALFLHGLTQVQISELMGVNASRVSQIYLRMVRRAQKRL